MPNNSLPITVKYKYVPTREHKKSLIAPVCIKKIIKLYTKSIIND